MTANSPDSALRVQGLVKRCADVVAVAGLVFDVPLRVAALRIFRWR